MNHEREYTVGWRARIAENYHPAGNPAAAQGWADADHAIKTGRDIRWSANPNWAKRYAIQERTPNVTETPVHDHYPSYDERRWQPKGEPDAQETREAAEPSQRPSGVAVDPGASSPKQEASGNRYDERLAWQL